MKQQKTVNKVMQNKTVFALCILTLLGCSTPKESTQGHEAAQTTSTSTNTEQTTPPEASTQPASSATKAMEISHVKISSTSLLKPEHLQAMELTKAMQTTLHEYAPNFVLWTVTDYPPRQVEHYPFAPNSLPYAVKGDFNGDGILDIALSGHDADNFILVVLMSKKNGEYQPVEMEKASCYKILHESFPDAQIKPLSLLSFKPKNLRFTEQGYTPLPFDGFLVKKIYDFRQYNPTDTDYMTFKEILDSEPGLYVWNKEKQKFTYRDTYCNDSVSLNQPDILRCF